MKAHLTGYFLTYRCVYLLDSACKGCSLQFFKFVVLFSRIMFLKSGLFYFVLVAKACGFCLRAGADLPPFKVNPTFIMFG